MSVISLSGNDSLLMGREPKGQLGKFIKKFRKMSKAQRKAAWKAIPRAKKAAWLLIAGPVLIPLIAAAGVAAVGTVAAMPMTALMMSRKMKKRKEAMDAKKREIHVTRARAIQKQSEGDTAGASVEIAKASTATAEYNAEAAALKSEQESTGTSATGATDEVDSVDEAESSSEAAADLAAIAPAPKKANTAALIPLAGLAALMFL